MPHKITFILLLAVSVSFAQDLYVADNSYLYARDVVVYVNDDIFDWCDISDADDNVSKCDTIPRPWKANK